MCSRSLELKNDPESESNWHTAERRYNILNKLKEFCVENGVSLALRGEVYGGSIQGLAHNPHTGGDIDFAVYSVYNIGERKYERCDDPFYSPYLAASLDIPHVPQLSTETALTKELIDHYDSETKTIMPEHNKFEGVVIQHAGGSFKIINKWYDSEKE